ncbi:glycosyltransferase family A protein [Alkalihalobacillus macyae]|uniref:glycosyltransferase family 2 protein n=1 Tax=Guptibacillus hwajinpoensis TaxID=208199 RepID=UPI00273B1097|nr:glycosyltransferase family A protein [Alkalihalobacillus macyae]MDP4550834.1 glycosyltransferase family A protein [Alkalihalobacillus macyae]
MDAINNHKNSVDISVIIPTYNKYPQNLLTLFSLENQQFDLSKVEVIMVDDGSTDQTSQILKNNNFPFDFKYIKNVKNIGRPAARNIGIRASSGSILIFLDAEILVQPDFLSIHSHYHKSQHNTVVTGVLFIKKLYSALIPGFSDSQLEQFRTLLIHNPALKRKYVDFLKNKAYTPLITKSQILNQSYKTLAFPTDYEEFYKRIIIKNYGYKLLNYQIPWQLFGTGHVSVQRQAIEEVGLFSEYPGYGWDDLEMGYKLYKNGAIFTTDRKLVSYHQEHPVFEGIKDESKLNYYRFQETYNAVDQMVISLTFLPVPFNLHEINQILILYKKLCHDYPVKFSLLKKNFHYMLREIGRLVSKQLPITNLKSKSFQASEEISTLKEKKLLEEIGGYHLFLKCYERLEKL